MYYFRIVLHLTQPQGFAEQNQEAADLILDTEVSGPNQLSSAPCHKCHLQGAAVHKTLFYVAISLFQCAVQGTVIIAAVGMAQWSLWDSQGCGTSEFIPPELPPQHPLQNGQWIKAAINTPALHSTL